MVNKHYFYVTYDRWLFETDIFEGLVYKGDYLWVPKKIIKEHDKKAKRILAHRVIFESIVNKTTESHNNLCSIYF